ncbi:NUDIX hydrolase domain-like protein [Mycena sanguinolenta]|nr:NUDIX hydrolase domain-like protein [Mycena sanguinolenta]
MGSRIPATLEHRNIPLAQLREVYPGKRITVGIAIVTDQPPKLLLLQRSADEDTLPNMYELPGGNCDPEDGTVLDTVVREALEVTGLVVSEVLSEFADFEYETRRGAAKQLNFLVRVQTPEGPGAQSLTPTLNPKEHQAYVWLESLNALDSLQMTDGMKKVVENAVKAMS